MKKQILLSFALLAASGLIYADIEITETADELAIAAQNPVANLISLPIQNNMNFDVGPGDDVQNITNVQPVYPITINDDWIVITRTIVPLVSQPDFGEGSTFGVGDTSFTAWASPSKTWNNITYGFGPAVILPTATDKRLGARQWGAGPSVVAVYMKDKWVAGALATNTWGFGRGNDEETNNFFCQSFVNYNLDRGWYLVSAPIITADWNADSDQRWTVPVGGGVGRVFRIGKQAMNINSQVFYNVEKPDHAGDFQWRFQVQWLFPK